MGKTKHAKSEEQNLGIIREQKKEIKRLNQRIKQLEKELGYRNKPHNDSKDEDDEVPPDCPSCAKGYLKELVVVGRRIFSCPVCDFRTRAVKI